MRSGYDILWTDHARDELKQTMQYLEEYWTARELQIFLKSLDHTIDLLSKSPHIFPRSTGKTRIHRVVIQKFNTMYYQINDDSIEILSLFSNRQNPKKRKI